jgi:hypothetical protein
MSSMCGTAVGNVVMLVHMMWATGILRVVCTGGMGLCPALCTDKMHTEQPSWLIPDG